MPSGKNQIKKNSPICSLKRVDLCSSADLKIFAARFIKARDRITNIASKISINELSLIACSPLINSIQNLKRIETISRVPKMLMMLTLTESSCVR